MKKTTFTLLLTLSCCWLAAQCPTGTNITFSTQAEIDNFPVAYPNCTEIEDSVTISGADITNLSGLSNIHSIGRALIIKNCASLTTLNGLENLQTIERAFRISNNAGLSSLSGLNNLETIYGGFWVSDNPALKNLQGLDELSYVGASAQQIFGSYFVNGLVIAGNDSLSTLLGLDSLRNVEGGMNLCCNNALTSLNGLGNLQSVGQEPNPLFPNTNFSIIENMNLESLAGLENLQSIKGYSMWFSDNANLVSLNGLDSVEFVGILEVNILNNQKLSVCHIPPICAIIDNPDAFFDVSNNAPGCNDWLELYYACTASPVDEVFSENPVIHISPNPATDFFQIQISDLEKWEISLFDLQGRQMFRQVISGSQTIGVKDWPSGIYTLRAVSGERVFSGKIVKQ